MSLKSVVTAAAIGAVLSIAALAETPEPASQRHQGWGLAIAYAAIGEACPGALSADDLASVRAFIAAGLAHSKRTDTAFDHDRFAREFRAEMTAKYADAANCTSAAIAAARRAVTQMLAREDASEGSGR